MEDNEHQPDHERSKQGLPGKQEDNREEHEPTEPTRRKPGEAGGGDKDSGGESGEGSQSTGNPNSAG